AFKGDEFPYLEFAGYKPSIGFSGGVSLDIVLPRNNHKWSFCNELIVTMSDFHGLYVYDNYSTPVSYTTELGFTYLKINTMARFKYPIGKVFIFVNGGITNGVIISEKNYLRKDWLIGNRNYTFEEKAIPDTKKYEFGLIGGLGLKFWKLNLDLRYEYGTGISLYHSLASLTNRVYCLLGYTFN
ncbi:MAG: hypothetical protein WCL00_11300, partial [Bacteroidota bacterium]